MFASTSVVPLLILAATIGVISPTGNEVGPFLAVEQAALSQTTPDARRTPTFAWYNLAGYVATATRGARGRLREPGAPRRPGFAAVDAYRAVVIGYAVDRARDGAWCSGGSARPSRRRRPRPTTGSAGASAWAASRGIIARLSALFALDAFGGGFIPQSLMAYWFHLQYGVEPAVLGAIFFGANLLAAVSSLSASRIAARIGLIRTMVFTHLPSNILLILVPLMPTLPLAVLVLLARFSLSQMDVPTRQSYVISVVEPDERSAAAGVTGIARTTGAAISPVLVGAARRERGAGGAPFYLAGGLKILYDVLLYRAFTSGRAPDERAQARRAGRRPRRRARRGSRRRAAAGRACPSRHQMNEDHGEADGERDQQVERLEGVADRPPSSAPRTVPAYTRSDRPEERAGGRVDDELPSGIRATPAGNEMNVRTIGSRRLKNTVAAPYFSKKRSASSISCWRIRRYLPYRSRNGRPPHAPIA